jgi:threonine dehydrogenase-like Zn-dependent dehydrogenase
LGALPGIRTVLLADPVKPNESPKQGPLESFDGERPGLVVEASGSPSGLELALSLVKPRGSIVLKSTHHSSTPLDLSQAVVNEISIIGSRCGRFHRAIDVLASGALDLKPLISARMPLSEGLEAFQIAADSASLKIILDVAA